jgi:hypothetical protein
MEPPSYARPEFLFCSCQVYRDGLGIQTGLDMRYERLEAISYCHQRLMALIRHGSFSSSRLAVVLRVSEQTICRDIIFQRRQGHAIRSVRLASSWAYQLIPVPADTPRSQKRTR